MTKRSNAYQRLHVGLIVLCASALVVLGVFYADGWIEFRKPGQNPDDSQSADKAKPAEAQIRAVRVAEQFVEMLGDEAYCYEFEGTWIDCWIEVEMDGKTQRLGAGPAEQVRILLEAREEYADPPRGYVLWVIHKNGDKEIWTVAVAVVNSESEVLTSSRSRGIPAPQPDPRPRGFTHTRTSKHSFNGDQPVALVKQGLMANVIARNTTIDNLQENVFFMQAEVTGRVFVDSNRNARQDRRKEGLRGIAVELLDDEGTVIDNTLTDARGRYQFENFRETGDYQVRIAVPGRRGETTNRTMDVLISRGGETRLSLARGGPFNDMIAADDRDGWNGEALSALVRAYLLVAFLELSVN